tara:strand:+ start:122 stop:433 length:312 start_codon:yes stop_codon:yes gene_type:complete
MPTVTYTCPNTGKKMKKTFPYNAVGKAQSSAFAKMSGGTKKNNPGYGDEKSTKSTRKSNIKKDPNNPNVIINTNTGDSYNLKTGKTTKAGAKKIKDIKKKRKL